MKEPKDKRTKEYKEWKANFDNDGIGTVIEKVTKTTGIKKVVEMFTSDGKDCGCDKRKTKLNKLKLKTRALRCLTEQQYNSWKTFKQRSNKNEVTMQEQKEIIIPIYAHVFAIQLKPMKCCIKPYIEAIDKVFNTYQ